MNIDTHFHPDILPFLQFNEPIRISELRKGPNQHPITEQLMEAALAKLTRERNS